MLESQQKQAWHTLTVEETEKALDYHGGGPERCRGRQAPRRLRSEQPAPEKGQERLADDLGAAHGRDGAHPHRRGGLFLDHVFFEDGEGLAECIVILVVVALNATVGVVQEKKAANALEALKNMTAPTARVLREGEESVVPAASSSPATSSISRTAASSPRTSASFRIPT